MFQELVNHNEDIRRLVEKGYAVDFDSNYLIVRDIPYLDDKLELRSGAFVANLVAIDKKRFVQDDHQVFFAGEHPCGLDGKSIPNLGGGPCGLPLSDAAADIPVQRQFSNKPKVTQAFADFFEKIESYAAIISGPAIHLHGVNPFTFRAPKSQVSTSVFKFHDTMTSRAEISDCKRRRNSRPR